MFEYKAVEEPGLEILRKKVKKLNKKAEKIGFAPLEMEVSDFYWVEEPRSEYEQHKPVTYLKVYDVEIHGDLPKYDNWVFLATIEGYPNGQNIIYKNPMFIEVHGDINIENYRSEKSYCDHCKTRRFRKNTFLVYNTETGEIYQVGSTCIKDFLGHSAPSFPFFSKMMKELEDIDLKDYSGGYGGKNYVNLREYLAHAAEIIARDGFIGKQKAYEQGATPTAHIVTNAFFEDNPLKKVHISNESYELADNVIEWGKKLQDREHLNDFLYSLSVLFNNEILEMRADGLATAAVFAYKNEMGLLEQKKAGHNPKNSEYFGEAKKRYEKELKLNKILEFDGHYGVTYFHVFYDEDDNQFVWYGTKMLEVYESAEWSDGVVNTVGKDGKKYHVRPMENGEKAKIKFTVKKHKEYNGIKQTVIKNCKLIEKTE